MAESVTEVLTVLAHAGLPILLVQRFRAVLASLPVEEQRPVLDFLRRVVNLPPVEPHVWQET